MHFTILLRFILAGLLPIAGSIAGWSSPVDLRASTPKRVSLGAAEVPRTALAAPPLQLTGEDWASLSAALYAFQAIESGFEVRTHSQGWTSRFDAFGFTTMPAGGDWSWGLDFLGLGWDGALECVRQPRGLRATGERLERDWGQGVIEWYINSARGLEHGFTLETRPEPLSAGLTPLVLEFAVRGGLLPSIVADGIDVRFEKPDGGGTALNYNGLHVFDADGRRIPARWQALGHASLRLVIDEAQARYPLTIDPIAQEAYIKASNTGFFDEFGFAVGLSGNTLVVGAKKEGSNATGVDGNQTNNNAPISGAAYVFVRSGTSWIQQAYLKASNTEIADRFGTSVAISGDVIVVGAPTEGSDATGINGNQGSNAAPGAGAAYVFVRTGSTWTQQAYLKASNSESMDGFGAKVAISGARIVVGAAFEDSNATGVGGDQANNGAPDSGAAYVFRSDGANWTQEAYLKASNTGDADAFGFTVAISSDTVVVGAIAEDSSSTGVDGDQVNNATTDSGAAYVFVRLANGWIQQAYLKASNTGPSDQFGWDVAVSGDTIAIGAPRESSNAKGVNGNQASDAMNSAGAVYVFQGESGIWSQVAYAKASNSGQFNLFGYALDLSGDRLVVGAIGEGSNAKGIDGNQDNTLTNFCGAAYLFERQGLTWKQRSYIKASNTQADDWFGADVALAGDLLVVAAPNEDSNATGFGGNQANNSASNSGACYAFDLDSSLGLAAYGSGTIGCFGALALSATQVPRIASPGFGLTCSNAPPLSAGFGVLATGQDLLGSDPFGLGVLLHVNPLSAALLPLPFSSDALGNAVAPAPIPNNPALVGQTLYAQVLWAWTSCPLPPFGLSTSNGLALTFLAP